MPRRLRYSVAVSLDGFIAGPDGGYEWIVMDPAIDFAAMFRQFDTAVMGRKTYDVMTARGGSGAQPGLSTVVFSRTLPPGKHRGVKILNDDPAEAIRGMKARRGRDIWLFGGGELFRTLLNAGLVDTVEVAVMPVLLGEGIPLLPPGASTTLRLDDHQVLPASGIVALSYSISGTDAPAPRITYVKPAKAAKAAKARKARTLPKRSNATKSRTRPVANGRRPKGHVAAKRRSSRRR